MNTYTANQIKILKETVSVNALEKGIDPSLFPAVGK